jgi:ethanolamine permease
VAVYYVLGVLYFAISGRNKLVLSPEEEFALTAGEHGVPGQAGYETSKAEQEAILAGRSGPTVDVTEHDAATGPTPPGSPTG